MICRVCGNSTERTLAAPYPPNWYRCDRCDSDSRVGGPTEYSKPYLDRYEAHISFENNLHSHRANLQWFDDHAGGCTGRSFLDVGCADGAAVFGMHERGWHPHGFDINPAVARGRFPITVAPAFNASFVPQVDALLCREVIEHVENWPEFLTELTRAVKPHGLLQVQTPMPSEMHPNIYQEDHLQIFAPGILEAEISKRGFQIIESRRWTDVQAGQVLIARKH